VNEMSRKSGAAPYRLDSPCALIIGGKVLRAFWNAQVNQA
jgi:hypothetical protein